MRWFLLLSATLCSLVTGTFFPSRNYTPSQNTNRKFQSNTNYAAPRFPKTYSFNYGTRFAKKEYDYIIVGAGNAGCALANRLTEDSDVTVLLLEAGSSELPLFSEIPLAAPIFASTPFNYGYVSEPQERACLGLNEQRCPWPHGKGVGGSSIINYVIYTRGNRKDFDLWSAAGNPGWSYDEILPYYKKIESANIRDFQDNGFHGFDGPVSVEDCPFRSEISHTMIKSAQLAGFPYLDYNSDYQMGTSYLQAHTKNGWRITAGKAYLEPIVHRKNLHVLTESTVIKIIINPETRVAKGVQFLRNQARFTVKARREVILSAGSFESPKLLMLSGIGPAQHLAELGVPVLVDLPVGQTMYEHIGVLGPLVTTNNIDNLLWMEQILIPPTGVVDFLNGKGPLTSNAVETLTYLRTQFSAYPDLDYPDVEIMQGFATVSYDSSPGTSRSFRISDEVYDAVFKPLENRRAFQFLPMLLHPRSKGFLKLRSTNPFDSPLFYPNYYEDDRDLEALVAAIREVIRILAQKPFQDIGAKLYEAKVPGCDFEFNTHEYWRCYVMHLSATFHHQVGVCKMGPEDDPTTVVDSRLRVHGIRNLRVVDTGVIPIPPSGHTSAFGFLIGERAADFIKEDWSGMGIVSPRFVPFLPYTSYNRNKRSLPVKKMPFDWQNDGREHFTFTPLHINASTKSPISTTVAGIKTLLLPIEDENDDKDRFFIDNTVNASTIHRPLVLKTSVSQSSSKTSTTFAQTSRQKRTTLQRVKRQAADSTFLTTNSLGEFLRVSLNRLRSGAAVAGNFVRTLASTSSGINTDDVAGPNRLDSLPSDEAPPVFNANFVNFRSKRSLGVTNLKFGPDKLGRGEQNDKNRKNI